MAATTEKNAIESRLEYLEGLWNEFAENPKPRMLRWLVEADEVSLVELFIDMQSEEIGQTPDLFIRFDDSFEDANGYGFRLLESLRKQYEEVRPGLAQEGIAADWNCPQPRPNELGAGAFLRVCVSLREHYQDQVQHLVLFLAPQEISNVDEWQKWLLSVARAGLPQHLRITVTDDKRSPLLDPPCKAEPVLIATCEPNLDMPEALAELAEQPEGVGPGHRFRRHFVALINASSKKDFAEMNAEAKAALKIATKQNWPQMQVVIHMAVGSTYLNAAEANKALASYHEAGVAANKAEEQGDPAGAKLFVQARFAAGAALVSEGRFAEAAPVYESISPLTAKQQDRLLTMESWRMAAYCHEMEKTFDQAWRCGALALQTADQMDAEMRMNSTLPYVGQGLLRLTKKSP